MTTPRHFRPVRHTQFASVDKRAQMIEQLMAWVGRSQPNPPAYRKHLLAMDMNELEQLWKESAP